MLLLRVLTREILASRPQEIQSVVLKWREWQSVSHVGYIDIWHERMKLTVNGVDRYQQAKSAFLWVLFDWIDYLVTCLLCIFVFSWLVLLIVIFWMLHVSWWVLLSQDPTSLNMSGLFSNAFWDSIQPNEYILINLAMNRKACSFFRSRKELFATIVGAVKNWTKLNITPCHSNYADA